MKGKERSTASHKPIPDSFMLSCPGKWAQTLASVGVSRTRSSEDRGCTANDGHLMDTICFVIKEGVKLCLPRPVRLRELGGEQTDRIRMVTYTVRGEM